MANSNSGVSSECRGRPPLSPPMTKCRWLPSIIATRSVMLSETSAILISTQTGRRLSGRLNS